jgi:hypothetical protein
MFILKTILIRRKNASLISFFVFLPIILIYDMKMFSTGNLVFYGDAQYYWESGRNFSLLNFTGASFRGYLFSFINFIIIRTSQLIGIDEKVLFLIISAIGFSFLMGILMPKLYTLMFDKEVMLFQIIMLFILISYFWRGYYLYPLSDFLALSLLLISIYFYVKQSKTQYKTRFLLLSGFFLGCAANVRPNYHYLADVIIVILVISMLLKVFKRNLNKATLSMDLILIPVGLLFISIPQIIINLHTFHKVGVFPPDGVQGGAKDQLLTFAQLQLGIGFQKFLPGLYPDWHGINLMLAEKGRPVPTLSATTDYYYIWNNYPINSFHEYFAIVFKHPIDFICIYFRHFFNGLDLKVHSVYYLPHATNGIMFSVFNYTLIFITSVFLYNRVKLVLTRKDISIPLIAFLIPACVHIPGGIECRYFLVFYILFYFILCFCVLGERKYINLKYYVKKYTFAYLLFVLVCLTMSSANLGEISPLW